MAKITKTKVGSEYRVRKKDGELSGEFNTKRGAKNRVEQLKALKRGRKK